MDLTMYMRLLPAPLVIKGFVEGDNACVYKQHFLIYQVQQGALLLTEAIQTQKCKTFSRLSQCPTWPMA